MAEVCGKDFSGENPGGWQRQWRNAIGINEREQQKMINMQMTMWARE